MYDKAVTLLDTWKAMESLVETGRCKAIGLSDVSLAQLRWLDTNIGAPYDICPGSEAPKVTSATYLAHPHSVIGLIARR